MKHELKELINRVNSLRPAWSKLAALTYMEMDALRQGQETLSQLLDDDWDLIREFFAYTPRDRENFPRVVKKASFMSDPSGTLAAAEEWAKTHRRRKPVHSTLNSGKSSHSDTSMEEGEPVDFADIFKEFRSKGPDPVNDV